jgi:hypothetical protein
VSPDELRGSNADEHQTSGNQDEGCFPDGQTDTDCQDAADEPSGNSNRVVV